MFPKVGGTTPLAAVLSYRGAVGGDSEFERLLKSLNVYCYTHKSNGSVMVYKTSKMTLLICQIYSQISMKLIFKEMMSWKEIKRRRVARKGNETFSRSNQLFPFSCLSASYSKEF